MKNTNNIQRDSYNQYITDVSNRNFEFNTSYISLIIVIGWILGIIGFFVYLFTL